MTLPHENKAKIFYNDKKMLEKYVRLMSHFDKGSPQYNDAYKGYRDYATKIANSRLNDKTARVVIKC